jgi:alkanesulfonate monooxygenase SsuD/methylene tetrahydromethanopterin reductase-like flavin-dependent oxidoreductase (luciferase family)
MTLHLTLSLGDSGWHPASWCASRRPRAPNAAALQALAQAAERGKLDAVLLGEPVATMQLDPLPLLGSMIAVTRRIGLAASWTVDFTEPFHVARVFATLDHLSYGRSAWIARMFDTEPLLPLIGKSSETDGLAAYCARAEEFVAVVKKLWDSWEDEGFALDKASGMFADPDRVHPITHAGRFFTVRGPLNVPRPPQGNPPLVMRDPSTEPGRRFVGATADVILTDRPTAGHAASRCRDLHALTGGRDVRILADLHCVLGDTETAARQRAATLDALAPPASGGARFVGTPAQLVELFADWQQQSACDGFNLLPAVLPDDVDLLINAAIPLAQRRGLFRLDYAGTTLREHLLLRRPRSQYATERAD